MNTFIDKKEETELTLSEAIKMGALLADVRTPEEFMTGHIAGSVNIPLNEIEDNLEYFKGKIAVVVYCQSGGRSAQAKHLLECNEIAPVFNGGSWMAVQKIIRS